MEVQQLDCETHVFDSPLPPPPLQGREIDLIFFIPKPTFVLLSLFYPGVIKGSETLNRQRDGAFKNPSPSAHPPLSDISDVSLRNNMHTFGKRKAIEDRGVSQ